MARVTNPQPDEVPVILQPLDQWTTAHRLTGHEPEKFGSQSAICRECRVIVRVENGVVVEHRDLMGS